MIATQSTKRANFAIASGVAGVKRFTRFPSGSRRSSDRLPHGIGGALALGATFLVGSLFGTVVG